MALLLNKTIVKYMKNCNELFENMTNAIILFSFKTNAIIFTRNNGDSVSFCNMFNN